MEKIKEGKKTRVNKKLKHTTYYRRRGQNHQKRAILRYFNKVSYQN